MAKKKNPHVGSAFDDWIAEESAKDPTFARDVAAGVERLRLARHVRALRERRKITQSELAERVGTKQPAIARLESGRGVPKLDFLERIARALGTRLEVRFVPPGA